MELANTLMQFLGLTRVLSGLTEDSIARQGFVGSDSETDLLPQVAAHIVLTRIGFPENATTLGSSCHFGSEEKACL